jgi:hypothetical protein
LTPDNPECYQSENQTAASPHEAGPELNLLTEHYDLKAFLHEDLLRN